MYHRRHLNISPIQWDQSLQWVFEETYLAVRTASVVVNCLVINELHKRQENETRAVMSTYNTPIKCIKMGCSVFLWDNFIKLYAKTLREYTWVLQAVNVAVNNLTKTANRARKMRQGKLRHVLKKQQCRSLSFLQSVGSRTKLECWENIPGRCQWQTR